MSGEDAGSPPAEKVKVLGIFALAMINVPPVLSMRNFPSMAEFGSARIGPELRKR